MFFTISASFAGEKHGKKPSIVDLRIEIENLKKEILILKQLIKSLSKPETKKVWKQVRPHIQIEGMIDDGYELVE